MNPDDEQLRILIEANRVDGNLITYQLLCELRDRRASLSREKVLREALAKADVLIHRAQAIMEFANRVPPRNIKAFSEAYLDWEKSKRAALASTETEK